MDMYYHSYCELLAALKANPTQENIENLADWFFQYGDGRYWNGECYHIKETDQYIRPIYEPEIIDDDGEVLQWQVDHYELEDY